TVTAGSGTKAYGAADPPLSATATGFTAADAATIALTVLRAPGEAVGSYATTALATGAAVSNYIVTYLGGTFTIVNHAPVAHDEGYVTNENVVLTVPAPGVLLNDTDVDPGDTLTAVLAADGTFALKLSWTAVVGATSYDVKRATVSGGPYDTIATAVRAAGYTDAGVAEGTVYYY